MSSEKLNYSSIGKTVDGTTYCSAVETLAENIIEDNEADATLIFPSATGWASMRSSSYRMESDNSEIYLPLPIYKIKRLQIKPIGTGVTFYVGTSVSTVDYSLFKDANGNEFVFDVGDYIKLSDEWKALPLAGSLLDARVGIYKENTISYQQNNNIIPIPSGQYQNGWSGTTAPAYQFLIFAALHREGEKYQYYSDIDESYHDFTDIYELKNIDVREWQFRIEYVPVSSKTKIRARKNAPTKQEYIQPFNQRAEINAASAFGKNMYLTAQKTGCKQITVVKNYTKLKDIPPLGALVRHNGKKYRLVANHYVQTNTVYLQVTHTLSENWSERSKHVAVDQKYRNWSIPQDTLWRNLYWEDYLRVGTSRKTSDDVTSGAALSDIMKGLCVISTDDKTVDTLVWYPSDDLGKIGEAKIVGATVPCSTYGIANSLIFSASFKDNLSAGLRANEWAKKINELEISYTCEEAMYCKADGTVSTARVVLSEGCGMSTSFVMDGNIDTLPEAVAAELDEKRHEFYPSVIEASYADGAGTEYAFTLNAPLNPVFDKEFYIYKDPGEAIKFTYQIHLIGEDDCFFGNKFAEHNPLIKDWKGADRKFKVWALTHYAREGSDILEIISGDTAYDHTTDGACFTIAELEQNGDEKGQYGEAYTLTLSDTMTATLQETGCKAWAITDENNNLYVACNDASITTLYFQLHHKR